MKRFLHLLRYIGINAACGLVLYFATFENVAGAQNVMTVLTWLFFIMSCTILPREARLRYQAKQAAKGGPSVPRWVDISIDAYFVLVLIWFGFILLGVLWMLHAVNIATAQQPVEPEEGGDA